ncbi:MAG TPA: helix-turn-helix domain-containing protein [Rubrivivax sp.]|nr:helix-turn-helix domain-containing protein [Rubrivivax sp.]
MPKPKDASLTYLRFLNLVSAVRSLPAFPALDAVEERVLNALAAVWAVGARVTVLEAVRLAPDVSASTVHRRLKGLQRKGLIALRDDASDSRVRIIEPTALATEWFSRLGQCLSVAAREA